MKILIVGAGVGGLALAGFLESSNHHVDVIEKRAALPTTGYAVGVWHNGIRVLERLGLADGLRTLGFTSRYQEFLDQRGKFLRRTDFASLNHAFGSAVRFTHRTELLSVLAKRLTKVKIQTGRHIRSMSNLPNGVAVTFVDGGSEVYELVVGADGIHSQVRKTQFGSPALRYAGARGWAFVAGGSETLRSLAGSVEMIGHGKMVGFYPLGNGTCGVLAISVFPKGFADPMDGLERLRHQFSDFGWVLPDVLRSLPTAEQIYWDDFKEVSLNQWHTANTVLIGDAAHGLLPTSGQGASLALEDAEVLSEELGDRSRPLAVALGRYQQRRLARVESVRRQARIVMRAMLHESAALCFLRNLYLRAVPERNQIRSLARFLAERT